MSEGPDFTRQTAGSTPQDPEPIPRQTDGRLNSQVMLCRQLTTLLGLLSGAWLPTGSGRPGAPATPTQSWTATNQSWALDPLVPISALGSWKAFLGLQNKQQGTGELQGGPSEASGMSLPLAPQEVLQETCKALPFVQVSLWWWWWLYLW